MNAPLLATKSLKALAQARLEQMSGTHLCRTFERTFAPEAAHLCSENGGQTCADETALQARCKDACRGLPVSPVDLLARLDEADKAAMRSGDPDELRALRAFAECLAERTNPALDAKIEKAYRWCREELAKHPEYRRATYTIDPDAEPVLIAVAVRGVGFATLKVDKSRYDGFELLELIHRMDMPESATTGTAA